MISLEANGHAWRPCICGAIECGHDYDENQVREFFDQAAVWARRKGYFLEPGVDYAARYLASRDRPGREPEIPEHARLFSAEKNDLKVARHERPASRHEGDARATNRPIRRQKAPHRPVMTIRA